ncbi:hypothetical protein GZ212_02545 [Mangrovimonas sp. CR14]|uniref:hypothetical protein n=1 Tax=Mangrovimonas sp. CR14 TaxID=2706120 RepID=UPI0014202A53|nr:hypothetical protein [Mangrovimonas sp. CR14]NIK91017.1 hypothetical protein [Mangrovimonas sp. CR14]
MFNRLVSTCLFLLFVAISTGPTILSILDEGLDVSIFYNLNEEENIQKEIAKHLEVEFLESNYSHLNSVFQEDSDLIVFYQKAYTPLSQENIYPPPEKHLH